MKEESFSRAHSMPVAFECMIECTGCLFCMRLHVQRSYCLALIALIALIAVACAALLLSLGNQGGGGGILLT